MFWKKILVIAAAGSLALLLFPNVQAQSSDHNLRDKRITINLREKPLWDVIMRLMNEYDLAIGLEQSNLDLDGVELRFSINRPGKDLDGFSEADQQFLLKSGIYWKQSHPITVEYRNERLEIVMDDIVKQLKNYDWELNDGVVNIFPIRGRDPRFAELMNLRVGKFFAARGSWARQIQSRILHQLPELQAFLRQNGFKPHANLDNNNWNPRHPLEQEMSFTDLTFKELLNAIVKSKRGGWILKRALPPDPEKALDLFELYI